MHEDAVVICKIAIGELDTHELKRTVIEKPKGFNDDAVAFKKTPRPIPTGEKGDKDSPPLGPKDR